MIRLFLKTAFRNLTRDPRTSLLNIGGLVAGLIVFLYIMVHVCNEFSFDRFHEKSDRIYRCVNEVKFGDREMKLADSNDPLAEAILSDLPEVESCVRVYNKREVVVSNEENSFIEPFVIYADSTFFNVFDFELISGNKETALSEPNSVLITEKAAKKYFGNKLPLGEDLIIGEHKILYKVAGILADIPKNSHLQFDLLASYASLRNWRYPNWGNWDGTYTYILVKPNINISEFKKKFGAFPIDYYAESIKQAIDIDWRDFIAGGNYINSILQPLTEIHLDASYEDDLLNKGNSRLLIILELVGILILIIACINYINITTARATNRAQEVGIKKVTGSRRSKLILQFLFEAFLQCFIAIILSLVLFIIILPVLNKVSGLEIWPQDLLNKWALITILILPLLLSFLAGGYPAMIITRLKPVNVIKSRIVSDRTSKWIRGSLVSFQFSVFLILIISVIGISKQIDYIKNMDTGFNKENVIELYNINQLGKKKPTFKEEILKDPNIVSASFNYLTGGGGNPFGPAGSSEKYIMGRLEADKDFAETYQIEIIDGNFFNSNNPTEREHVILNESAARILGIDNCDNAYIRDYNREIACQVIGIVKDFQRRSFHFKVEPTVIVFDESYGNLSIRLAENATDQALASLEKTWKRFDATTPFTYVFKDDIINNQYKADDQLSVILKASTLFAIIISCLGLMGLVAYTANSRRKEIGVRKVNGAKIVEILALLNQDFLKWIIVSLVISMPVAWIIINKWLNNFAIRISIDWWVFLFAGVMALGIALVTVSWQSWKAASRNPVEALRYE